MLSWKNCYQLKTKRDSWCSGFNLHTKILLKDNYGKRGKLESDRKRRINTRAHKTGWKSKGNLSTQWKTSNFLFLKKQPYFSERFYLFYRGLFNGQQLWSALLLSKQWEEQHPRFRANKIFGSSIGFKWKLDVVYYPSTASICFSHLLISSGASARALSNAPIEKTFLCLWLMAFSLILD